MNECSACHVDYYYNPDVRVLYSSVCDHRVCESCISRLFQPGPYKCPACERHLSAQDFSKHPREARQVDSEVKVRRQIAEIFCKTEEDFRSLDEYNEYLAEREDILFRLTNPTSQDEVKQTWDQVEKYREHNAAQIRRVRQQAPRKKFQKILKIIEEESAFYSNVNSEWGDSRGADALHHPFKTRYQSLLSQPPPEERPMSADIQPISPTGGGQPKTLARHMNGAGGLPDAYLKKARHFFFNDLLAATSAMA